MRRVWLTALLAGCSLAVTARGHLRALPDRVEITASNGKSRPLVLSGDARALGAADGLLVEVDGTLRGGAIVVEGWRIVEGPHGLAAYVGTLRSDARRVWLELDAGGPPVLLRLGITPLPEGAVGSKVLVEGPAVGPEELQVVAVRVLLPAAAPK